MIMNPRTKKNSSLKASRFRTESENKRTVRRMPPIDLPFQLTRSVIKGLSTIVRITLERRATDRAHFLVDLVELQLPRHTIITVVTKLMDVARS